MDHNYFKYLDITPFDHRWGTYVTSVGCTKVDPDHEYPDNQRHPTSHRFTWDRGRILYDYYIVFIAKGKGIFATELTSPEEVVAGNCFFLFPGIRHRYKPDIRLGWEEFWVGFNGKSIRALMKEAFFDEYNPIIDLGYNTGILILYNNLIENVQASLVGYRQQIAGITLQLLGSIYNKAKFGNHSNNPVEKLIAKAKFIMQESTENTLNMELLSSQLPMGYSSFRKAFKQLTGETPNQYHLKLRMERAKYLLTKTNLNISEIGYETGFDSVFYFSKLFKKKYGISPTKFRLMNLD